MVAISVGQFGPAGNKAQNVSKIQQLAASARRDGAAVLVLPEYSAYMPPRSDERIVDNAEPIDGRFTAAMTKIAQENRILVVFGMAEEIPGEQRVHNTIVFVDDTGSIRGAYRKLHLYDVAGYSESKWVLPGDIAQPVSVVVEGLSFSTQTCYDLRFPEVTRTLMDVGADVVVVPAQWLPGPLKEYQWLTLLCARAIENTAYIAAAGQIPPLGCGQSVIVDPMGVPIARLGESSGVVTADVNMERLAEVRSKMPSLESRRFQVTPNARLDDS